MSQHQGSIMIPASYNDDTLPVSGRDGGPASSWTRSPSVWTLGGADAPARRLRAALMSPHQGPMVSLSWLAGIKHHSPIATPSRRGSAPPTK